MIYPLCRNVPNAGLSWRVWGRRLSAAARWLPACCQRLGAGSAMTAGDLALAVFIAVSVAGGSVLASITLGAPVVLSVGEVARIVGEDLVLTFEGVARDNRCPKGVQCIVAGAATVVVTVRRSGEPAAKVTFDVPPEGSASARFADYEITIAKVEPGVRYGKRIAPDEYLVTILVARP